MLYNVAQRWNHPSRPNLQTISSGWSPPDGWNGVFSTVSKGVKHDDSTQYVKSFGGPTASGAIALCDQEFPCSVDLLMMIAVVNR
jgi:hypothetical protein